MGWEKFNLDRKAHDLVLKYRDKKDASNQVYKMRMTVAYGLERFWGEQFRLVKEKDKADYWNDTWKTLVNIMTEAGVILPNDNINPDNSDAIKEMATKLWNFPVEQRKVTIAVLTELCDSMVWWTQRYKKSGGNGDD
ncbi:MAG: hypothetical protein RLZZ338_2652 [Cyanobacteriota bacterium]|jgi:hypothetical protein